MEQENRFPIRKKLRITEHDYSSRGAYFVTICVHDRKRLLSEIIEPVGCGALDAPPESWILNVGGDVPNDPYMLSIRLTDIGKIVEKYLLSSQNISGVMIDQYVIMPDHVHAIIILNPDEYIKGLDGSSRAPNPTNEMLPHVISTLKRFCNKEIGEKIFQRGYMEHIIRDREDYETRRKYIYENPMRWYYKYKN